jgi:hypothetical protein
MLNMTVLSGGILSLSAPGFLFYTLKTVSYPPQYPKLFLGTIDVDTPTALTSATFMQCRAACCPAFLRFVTQLAVNRKTAPRRGQI